MSASPQVEEAAESRTERATATVTKSEKEALRLVTIVDKIDESTLLRDWTITSVVARAEEIRARLG